MKRLSWSVLTSVMLIICCSYAEARTAGQEKGQFNRMNQQHWDTINQGSATQMPVMRDSIPPPPDSVPVPPIPRPDSIPHL